MIPSTSTMGQRSGDRRSGVSGVRLARSVLGLGLALMLLIGGLGDASAADRRAKPLLIGALTESWGPTPAIVGLRDALVALGF